MPILVQVAGLLRPKRLTLAICVLAIVAMTSCELAGFGASGASRGRSLWRVAPASASESKGSEQRPDGRVGSEIRVCGYAFQNATRAEVQAFVTDADGLWRDQLSGEMSANSLAQPGLEISPKHIAPIEVDVTDKGAEPGGVAAFRVVREPRRISVGPVLDDGFRLVQLNFESDDASASCEVYAFKPQRLAEGQTVLLVRGPVSPSGLSAASIEGFRQAVHGETRIFVH